MENGIEIEITDASKTVEVLKLYISQALESCESELLELVLPEESDYESKSDYEEDRKEIMVQLVEDIETIKSNLFKIVLESYNKYIEQMHLFTDKAETQKEESLRVLARKKNSIKKCTIIGAAVSFVFPPTFPLVLAVDLPVIGYNLLVSASHLGRLGYNQENIDKYKEVQIPFYDFVDTLRTDYHQSKKELKELKERASQGEDIVSELHPYIEPERLSLKRLKNISEIDFGKNAKIKVKK